MPFPSCSASLDVLLTGVADLFYPWNVPTPWWVGFIVQRPGSHCIHHQEGVHPCNCADLPLWDMLSGTCRNPGRWDARRGFGAQWERRLAGRLRSSCITRPGAGMPA